MARQILRTSLFVGGVALFSMTTLGTQTSFAETSVGAVEPDPTIVGVIDGPGGIGYWVVSADGSVEVRAEGSELALKSLIQKVNQGPQISRVDDVNITWSKSNQEFDHFDIVH